jgi:uncharacterized RDD family membrane protein YckC
MPWYYRDGEASVGPMSRERLDELSLSGVIEPQTLVWEDADGFWRPFAEIDTALPSWLPPVQLGGSEELEATVQSVGTTDVQALPKRWKPGGDVPWRRFFARVLDTLIHGVIGFAILSFALYSFAPVSADGLLAFLAGRQGNLIASFLAVLVAIPITATVIGLTGSSIGKFLFGVKVVRQDFQPIGFPQALRRELKVWANGLAFGLPIASLVAMGIAFGRLGSKEVTSWDEGRPFLVAHRLRGAVQSILFVSGCALYVLMMLALRTLE